MNITYSGMTGVMHIHSLRIALKIDCRNGENDFEAYLDVFIDMVETAEFFSISRTGSPERRSSGWTAQS